MKKRLLQVTLIALGVLLLLGLAAPFIKADAYRGRIESALRRALNRDVKIQGNVSLNLFTGPGFTIEKVEISDDPSMGIEPMAYVDSLELRVKLQTLWTRQLEFSNLKLKDPTLNLVQTDAGVWNFQLLRGVATGFPTIQVRNGKIFIKFGDTKSIFYLSESDLDVDPLDENRVDVRFIGQPSRTDQAAQSFGRLLARGIWKRSPDAEPELNLNAELERSAITELARIVEGRGIGVHGMVASRAQIKGPISKLAITGQMKLEDVHRWDLLPKGGAWQLNYRGSLDLVGQRLELESAEKENPGAPVIVRFRASELLSKPRWAASAELHDVAASAFVESARHMGAPLPDGIAVDGKLNGAVGFSRPGGLQGKLEATDSTVKLPGAAVVKFHSANVLLDGSRITVGPSTAEAENGETAELTASYDVAGPALEVQISTTGMKAGESLKGVGIGVPLLANGSWKGSLLYRKNAGEDGVWSGNFDVRDARVDVQGIAGSVKLTSANVDFYSKSIAIRRIKGTLGDIRFSGEYRSDADSADHM